MTSAVRPSRAATQRLLDGDLRLRVEVRRGLVEDHDAWLGQQQAGDRQALPFTAGQSVAALADDRVEAVGERAHEVGQPGLLERGPQLGVGGVRRGVAQVGPDRVVEQVPVLGDDADRVADRLERQVAHVDAGQAHGARVGVVEPGHERGERRLAGAGRADEGDGLAGFDAERDVVEHLLARPVVEHGDLLQRRQRHPVGRRVGEPDTGQLDGDGSRPAAPRGSAGSAISGSMSSTSKTRSKLTSAVTTSRRAVPSAVNGPYSRLSSRAIVTTVPGSRRPWTAR